jgi:hypothetical protein
VNTPTPLASAVFWPAVLLDVVRTRFPDPAAVSAALNKESVAVLSSLSRLTKERARSWRPRFLKSDYVRQEGDFARAYLRGTAQGSR